MRGSANLDLTSADSCVGVSILLAEQSPLHDARQGLRVLMQAADKGHALLDAAGRALARLLAEIDQLPPDTLTDKTAFG